MLAKLELWIGDILRSLYRLTVGSAGPVVTGTLTVQSGQLLLPDGSLATPSLAFSDETSLGLYSPTTATIALTRSSVQHVRVLDGSWADWSITLSPTAALVWNSAAIPSGASTPDLKLYRDAANTLAQRNGTAAQQSNIYFSYTDGSNYERLALKTASGSYTIEAETAGSGTDNINLRLTPAGTGTVVVLNGGGVNNLLRIGTINTRTITQLFAAGMYGWTSASGADGGDNDTNLGRAAAGVVAAYGASSATAGWIQNTAARSRVANDVTNATITPANITGLSATLIAGRKYSGRLVLFINNALAADGLRLDFDGGTATMTSFRAGFEAGANVTTFGTMNSSALATDLTIDAFSGTGDSVVVVSFSLVCNAAGTFIPRIAKEADAAGATLTVYTNSFMWLEDVP